MIVDHQPGLWCQRFTQNRFINQPALFLDRDGVVVEEVNYLGRAEDVKLIEPVADAIAAANRANVPVVMITNQSGVGRGYFDWQDFSAVQETIYDQIAIVGAHIDLVLACAYHCKAQGRYKISNHGWRKPGGGMLCEAQQILKVDLANSLVVGDKLTDIAAGDAAGLTAGTLVRTGHGAEEIRNQSLEIIRWTARQEFMFSIADHGGMAIKSWLTTIIENSKE